MSTGKELAVPEYTVSDLQSMAKQVSASGLFGMNEAQMFTLMLLCQSKGLHPIEAAQRYDIVQGRPAMKAAAIQAEFQAQGGRVRWLETSATRAAAEFSHSQLYPDPLLVEFTMEEARIAGLSGKDNYKKNPADMLVARVISKGVRRVMPGVVTGIYTPDEVADFEPPARTIDVTPRANGLASKAEVNAAFRQPGAPPAPAPTEEPKPGNGSQPGLWRSFCDDRAQQVCEFCTAEAEQAGVHTQAMARMRKNPPVNAYGILNGVYNLAIEAGVLQETDPARDSKSRPSAMQALWEDQPDWCQRATSDYLKKKVREFRKNHGIAPQPEPVTVPDDRPEDEPEWVEGRE